MSRKGLLQVGSTACPSRCSATRTAARTVSGVRSTLGLIPGRATCVIDRQGVARHVLSSQLRVGEHVRSALEGVRRLSSHGGTAPAA